MLLTHFLVVKSIIGIVTSLLINDLHPGEMLLGTDPEMLHPGEMLLGTDP